MLLRMSLNIHHIEECYKEDFLILIRAIFYVLRILLCDKPGDFQSEAQYQFQSK
jgi:hypothetical protein